LNGIQEVSGSIPLSSTNLPFPRHAVPVTEHKQMLADRFGPPGRFRRYGFTAPNIAEIAENKKRTN
jgi:hypothetical protein